MKTHAVMGFAALNPSYEASAAQNGAPCKTGEAPSHMPPARLEPAATPVMMRLKQNVRGVEGGLTNDRDGRRACAGVQGCRYPFHRRASGRRVGRADGSRPPAA